MKSSRSFNKSTMLNDNIFLENATLSFHDNMQLGFWMVSPVGGDSFSIQELMRLMFGIC